MSRNEEHQYEPDGADHPEGDTAVQAPPKPKPAKPQRSQLPRFKLILHNDDVNEMLSVVAAIVQLTHLRRPEAFQRMIEAHQRGLTLLMTTHREHAELLEEQFASKRLTVTIEPE